MPKLINYIKKTASKARHYKLFGKIWNRSKIMLKNEIKSIEKETVLKKVERHIPKMLKFFWKKSNS